MSNALSTVNQHQCTVSLGHLYQFFHRIHGTQRIRYMRESNHTCIRAKVTLERFDIQLAVIKDGRNTQCGTTLNTGLLPGNQVRVVFHFGNNHFITGFQLFGQAMGYHIDTFGSTRCPDHFFTTICINERSNLITCFFVSARRFIR